jgi:hypothetical protein
VRVRVPLLLTVLGIGFSAAAGAEEESYFRRRVALHLHSLISPEGKTSLQALASLAPKRGVDVLIPTDHLLLRWTYGLEPMPGVFRRTFSRSSVYDFGVDSYFRIMDRVNTDYPHTLVVPGVETTPAAFWTGHPAKGNLTLREADRHLLVVGVTSEAMARLPILGRPGFGDVDWKPLAAPLLVTIAGFLLALRRPAGLLVAVMGILWTVNQRPFRRPPEAFASFTRDGYDAAQAVIDSAAAAGGLVIWAHPDVEIQGKLSRSVRRETAPYPEALLKTRGHAGFGFFPHGIETGAAGNVWDRGLREFSRGERKHPFWAFSEWESHPGEGVLSGAVNVAWVRDSTAGGVLEALQKGRFYAVRPIEGEEPVLEEWEIRTAGDTFPSGETSEWKEDSRLRGAVRYARTRGGRDTVQIIRNGHLWKEAPVDGRFRAESRLPRPERLDIYRLIVLRGGTPVLAANPVFVRVPAAPPARE